MLGGGGSCNNLGSNNNNNNCCFHSNYNGQLLEPNGNSLKRLHTKRNLKDKQEVKCFFNYIKFAIVNS